MSEWRDLPTMQDVAAALAAGDEIIYSTKQGEWGPWEGRYWHANNKFRARPRKPATKEIVLRRALLSSGEDFYPIEGTADFSTYKNFVMWLPGEETVEVPA